MAGSDISSYEVTFCSRVAGWANNLFEKHTDWPFKKAAIEESKHIGRKRSDLRIYGRGKRLVLAGETKMPGTPEGRNPYVPKLLDDAAQKADKAGAEFFFTWNVNQLALFDRSKYFLPLMERRVQEFSLGLELERPEDVERPEVEKRLQEFLAEFFGKFADIADGKQQDWSMPPDQYFVRAYEHHILWPAKLTTELLWERANADKGFDHRLQEWLSKEQSWQFLRKDPADWRQVLDRAARTLCYVFGNRVIFYEACKARFPDALNSLKISKGTHKPEDLYRRFQRSFQDAVNETGDYETLFYPDENDWIGPLVFGHDDSAEAWRSVIQHCQQFDFSKIPTDVLGNIFRRLLDPEERHKFGQHYTNEDLVDVVNAFCIRHAEANMLDPAGGSGSFVVRGYHRKAWLKQKECLRHPSVSHQDWLRQIYTVDISLFAAHLATLNLAARDIKDEENYPRVRRGNFFEVADDVAKKKPFCLLPHGLRGERKPGPIYLPPLDAVMGNPPYVRQELIPKRGEKGVKHMQAKEDLHDLCARFWPGLDLSGRSDLHCYFWPVATFFLKVNGWFGFLTSSSWLDAAYGFALQEWILSNFRVHAILESNAEPWFEDARINTCAVILQRCADSAAREAQLVKFVRLDAPLKTILGERPDENARQTAAEEFRDEILACKKNSTRDGWRVVVNKQKDLWEDGLRAGRLFEMQKRRDFSENVRADTGADEDDEAETPQSDGDGNGQLHEISATGYGGGKWGKYLRAPNLYFRIMDRYANRFVPLGEIATIRFGIKSGCDAFFMPRDVSADFLEKYSKMDWNNAPLISHCKRAEVESGEVKLVEAGNGTVHPVEAEFLKPEVHSPMEVSRPIVSALELKRLILLVAEPMQNLKGTHVQKYLRYGEKTTFASKKSKAVPVPKRSTCAARNPWYDVTKLKPGVMFWPMIQKYRHVIPANPEKLICNHRLFDVHPFELNEEEISVLQAVANSTLVGLFKFYYGRYAGTEGTMDTDVIDVNLIEIPDPRHVTKPVSERLKTAFSSLCERPTRHLVEQDFLECQSAERAKKLAEQPISLPTELEMKDRRALDLAVFELLGVADETERRALCDELYRETAAHFRHNRILDIQKQEQRAGTAGREFRTDELAADLWDSLADDNKQPLAEWLADRVSGGKTWSIPEGQASLPDANDMLDATTVFFRQQTGGRPEVKSLRLPSRSHAETVFTLVQLGWHSSIPLPNSEAAAQELNEHLHARLAAIREKAAHLAQSRTSDERKAGDLAGLLSHWLIHGKPSKMANARKK